MFRKFFFLVVFMLSISGFADAAEIPLYTANLNYANGFASGDKIIHATYGNVNVLPYEQRISVIGNNANSCIHVITNKYTPPMVTGKYRVTVFYMASAGFTLNFYAGENVGPTYLLPKNLIATTACQPASATSIGCSADIPLNSLGHIDTVIKIVGNAAPWVTGITIQRFALTPSSIGPTVSPNTSTPSIR